MIGLKPYCCCGTSIAGIDAVSKITREHDINTKEIKEIIVSASPETYKLTATIEPTDVTSAQLSGRFSIALRLIKGGNGFNEYTESNIRDSEILDLTERIKYTLDEDLAKTRECENPTKVTIRLIDGTVHEETVYAGKGSILNPMTHEEVCQKFREFASMILPEKNNVEAIIKTVEELDSVNNIRELSQLLVTS